MGVRCLPRHAREVVLVLDAMGHLVHGTQEGRHFSGYYGDIVTCHFYVFCGDVPLWAQRRTADQDGDADVVLALEKIVASLRKRSPEARILLRADSDFCRAAIMAWCEGQREVYYCLGLAKNPVLVERLAPALADARARRVIGKAEVSGAGDNPRCLVTNLPAEASPKRTSESSRIGPGLARRG